MSVEMMGVLSKGTFALAGVLAVVAVILWFYLDVRGVIADLRGKKAKLEWNSVGTEVKTTALEEEVTALLNGYRLVIDEMVVHTEEEI